MALSSKRHLWHSFLLLRPAGLVVVLLALVVRPQCSSFVLGPTTTRTMERTRRRIHHHYRHHHPQDPPLSRAGFRQPLAVARPAKVRRLTNCWIRSTSTSVHDDDHDDDAPMVPTTTTPTTDETSTSTTLLVPALPKLIVTCATTEELNEAVKCYIQPHHTVVEMGSQLREVSTSICELCHTAVLVDVRRKFPNAQRDPRRTGAMRLPPQGGGGGDNEEPFFFPHKASFHEIAQLSDWTWTVFSDPSTTATTATATATTTTSTTTTHRRSSYDVLVLDVNAIVGNDLEWTSLQMIQQFHAINHRADLLVLVKSSALNQWANRIHHPTYWRNHHEELWNLMKNANNQKNNHSSPPFFVVATVGVDEYRNTMDHTVRPTDFVLELGCHYGTTTALLKEKVTHCMGVDVGSKIIAHAKNRFPGIDFRVGDAWKTAELLRFLKDYQQSYEEQMVVVGGAPAADMSTTINGFDVVYVDVGGLSGSDGMLEAIQLISSIRYALEPRCIVIKSRCMQRLSTSLMSFWMLKRKQRKEKVSSLLIGPER